MHFVSLNFLNSKSYPSGNDVQFLSRPSLERTSSNVIIKNCTYTSARNQDLAQYASVRINNDTFGIDLTTSVGLLSVAVLGGRYTLPDLAVPRMDSADVSCVFYIGEETFVSRVSRLYAQPGWLIFLHFLFIAFTLNLKPY